MKRYENFQIEDFVCDDDFIGWCLQPSKASDTFWNNWIKTNPSKKELLVSAKQLVLDLHDIEKEEHQQNFEQQIWENITHSIDQKGNTKANKGHRQTWIGIAATLLFLIGSWGIYQWTNTQQSIDKPITTWINFENNQGIIKTIQLADGSTIQLEPYSSLKYPTTFSSDQREVFLQGEAFFDIARDTLKPFLVYANETITKVLGTSFTIKAFEGEKTVEVAVKTGKVAVYAKVASDEQNEKPKQLLVQADKDILLPVPNKKLEVTPNQRVVFDKQEAEMVKKVVVKPEVITKVENLPQFEFNDASVVKVFEALELAYGIDLTYDTATLATCTITTKLGQETLFEKLTIISLALDLSFEEQDASIVIQGVGCN